VEESRLRGDSLGFLLVYGADRLGKLPLGGGSACEDLGTERG